MRLLVLLLAVGAVPVMLLRRAAVLCAAGLLLLWLQDMWREVKTNLPHCNLETVERQGEGCAQQHPRRCAASQSSWLVADQRGDVVRLAVAVCAWLSMINCSQPSPPTSLSACALMMSKTGTTSDTCCTLRQLV